MRDPESGDGGGESVEVEGSIMSLSCKYVRCPFGQMSKWENEANDDDNKMCVVIVMPSALTFALRRE